MIAVDQDGNLLVGIELTLLMQRYGLDDTLLWAIARVVHEADLEVVELSERLYDGLDTYHKRAGVLAGEPA